MRGDVYKRQGEGAARVEFDGHQRVAGFVNFYTGRGEFLPIPRENQFFRRIDLAVGDGLPEGFSSRLFDFHYVRAAGLGVVRVKARFVAREPAHPFLDFFALGPCVENFLARRDEHAADFQFGFECVGGACHGRSPRDRFARHRIYQSGSATTSLEGRSGGFAGSRCV